MELALNYSNLLPIEIKVDEETGREKVCLQTSFDLFGVLLNSGGLTTKDITDDMEKDSGLDIEYHLNGYEVGNFALKWMRDRVYLDSLGTINNEATYNDVKKEILKDYGLNLDMDLAIPGLGSYIMYDIIKLSKKKGYHRIELVSYDSSLGFYTKVLGRFISRGIIKRFVVEELDDENNIIIYL